MGRAHLKTVLDSDKREIRLLQEMYLEDGELHGEGRQRQFRLVFSWGNGSIQFSEQHLYLHWGRMCWIKHGTVFLYFPTQMEEP